MRIFVIVDSSKRKSEPLGVLIWRKDSAGDRGSFALELCSGQQPGRLPLSLSFLDDKERSRATPQEAGDWVRSRIVPESRHNINEILAANGLLEYDEVSLLAACQGRSSDDDLMAYEVSFPERVLEKLEKTMAIAESSREPAGEAAKPRSPSIADLVVSVVERQRAGREVRYAFVGLPRETPGASIAFSEDETPDSASTPKNNLKPNRAKDTTSSQAGQTTSAQRIAAGIRARRKEAGLTQKQLAARAGITQTVLSRVESGSGNPTLALLEEIAFALDTKLDIALNPIE